MRQDLAMKVKSFGPQLRVAPKIAKEKKILATYKKVIVQVGFATAENVDFDGRRGVLWIGRTRVAEWKDDSEGGKLQVVQAKLREAGLDVTTKVLEDAVKEALSLGSMRYKSDLVPSYY